jgi:2-keto-4-pentenoate hydratase/2-oxohepta-3-ene-1,7-dioic acid hydratase in catechol pathway
MAKPDLILQELQTFLSLEDGDIVMTGTPKGVGVINLSDNFFGQVYLNEPNNQIHGRVLLDCDWKV